MSDYDQRVQNLHGNHEDIIRDVHALSPSLYPNSSMATSDQGFSNMSVTNSTQVLAGSPVASSLIENESVSNWGTFGLQPSLSRGDGGSVASHGGRELAVAPVIRSYKKEEVESKITAWKNAKIAEINNRFKCEDAIINGWETEQAQQSALQMKKVERKLEEKRVRALEKMENEIAKAHRKAEERRASAEGKRGTKIARVLEVANLMKAVGRAPVKNSVF